MRREAGQGEASEEGEEEEEEGEGLRQGRRA